MRAILLGLLLVVSACYRPSLGDCQVRCSSASPACPSGLSCDTAEGFCQAETSFDCSSVLPDGGPPPGTENYAALSVGVEHACAIRAADHSLWCWGFGVDGALGDGLTQSSALPVRAGQLGDWFAVSAGNDYSCGLRAGDASAGGSLYCWGLNNLAQIDFDTRGTNVSVPLDVSRGKKWKAVSAGRGGTTCAIDAQDHLFCGGENDEGQTGTGQPEQFLAMTQVGSATWRSVSAAYDHSCGIQSSGELYCWGANNVATAGFDGVLGTGDNMNHPVPTRVGTGSDWVAISASPSFNCGIRGDASAGGNLYCWGRDSGNLGKGNGGGAAQTTPLLVGNPVSDKDWKTIDSDGRHSCGMRGAGQLYCFGLGEEGAVGLGDRKEQFLPARIDDAVWQRGGAGQFFSCGLRDDGAVLCWGLDDDGQLGDGHPSIETEPVRVGSQTGWDYLALGQHHSCGLRGSELSCWGMNQWGQLGLGAGKTDEQTTPQVVAGTWKNVAAGGWHTCGVDGTDALLCWGDNYDGALGTGDPTGSDSVHSVPKKVVGSGVPTTWLQVEAGLAHTCAVSMGRTLWCWGANFAGQLGQGPSLMGQNRPVQVGTDVDWSSVVGGTAFSCALHDEAVGGPGVWCFGENNHGQLGRGAPGADSGVPMIVDTGTALFGQLVATGEHTCAIVQPGNELRCWGGNGIGLLGNGTLDDSGTPVAPVDGGAWQSISVGHAHTCGVKKVDGTLWCWGTGDYGQLGNGVASGEIFDAPRQIGSETTWSQVFGGWEHACGIKTDGSLWCWGRNSRGQVGNGQSSTLVPRRIADPAAGP